VWIVLDARLGKPAVLTGIALLVIGLLVVGLAPRVSAGGVGRADVEVYSIDSFMTAVYKVYGNPSLGYWVAKTVIRNVGDGPLYDVDIQYKIEGLTGWSEVKRYPLIPSGGAVVDLYYPILSSPPDVESATPGKLYVKIRYRSNRGGEVQSVVKTKPLKILGLHDFVFSGIPPEENTGSFQDLFSNYELLAAWVTPKDPVVERYADMANKLTGSGAGASINDDEALKFLEAVWDFSVYNGITYQTEPQAYWTGKSAQWVKYPRDVIRDKSGTCLDTSIFLASLAMSQGLKAYIMIIPGHAIPIVELPSGKLLPIESTMLGPKASFQDAASKAIEEVQEAFNGPHLIVDVASLQAKGIVPPELPSLPSDVLEKWGYKLPGTQASSPSGSNGAGGGEGGGANGGGNSVKLTNPFGDLPWSVSIPADWSVEKDSGDYYRAVYIDSPDNLVSLAIYWSTSMTGQDFRAAIENLFDEYAGGFSIAGENQHGRAGNMQAVTVAYNLADGGFAIARYGDVNGYGVAVVYVIDSSAVSEQNIYYMEQVVSTFTIGE
jgi:hypothetical protein